MALIDTRLEMWKISYQIADEMDLILKRIANSGSDSDVLMNLKKINWFLSEYNKNLAVELMKKNQILNN